MKCPLCAQELVLDHQGKPTEHASIYECIVALKMRIMELEAFQKLVVDCGFAIYKEGGRQAGLSIHGVIYFPERDFINQEEIMNEEYDGQKKFYPDGEAKAPDEAAEMCSWKMDEDGIYTTSCGHTFYFEDSCLAEVGANFCLYCGRPILDLPYIGD